MIMILGSTHDDVLYFESVMTNKRNEMILDRYPAQIGMIFNQEVILVHSLYTSYISALVTSYIIQKYFVILTFIVGKCVAFNNDFKRGDIALSKRIIVGDVDQIKEANVNLGQLPGFPRSFVTEEEVTQYMSNSIEKRTFANYKPATFVSSNAIVDSQEKLERMYMDGYILGHKDSVVFDCTSGGVAIASYINKIPCVAIKVVERLVGQTSNADNYIKVLKRYSDLGKAIVTCIGDIGRNDIIRGE